MDPECCFSVVVFSLVLVYQRFFNHLCPFVFGYHKLIHYLTDLKTRAGVFVITTAILPTSSFIVLFNEGEDNI